MLAVLIAACLAAILLATCSGSPVHAQPEREPSQVCRALPGGEWDTWVFATVADAIEYVRDNPGSFLMYDADGYHPCPPVDVPTPQPQPTPIAPCPGDIVSARVSITGEVTIENSTGAAVGPFNLTITTTSNIGIVVAEWSGVTVQARARLHIGRAWPGMPARVMGTWRSAARFGAGCEEQLVGNGYRLWFPFMFR